MIWKQGADTFRYNVYNEKQRLIATTWAGTDSRDGKHARLISTAPELLELLKEAQEILSDNPHPSEGGDPGVHELYRRIGRAIKKAEGK